MDRSTARNRRDFLRAATGTVLAAGASTAWMGTAVAGQTPARGRHLPPNKIGIQLYTMRSLMSESVEDTLTFLSRVGYAEVEFAGLYGYSPERMRDLLRHLKLQAPASHDSIPSNQDQLEQLLEQARTLGQRWVVLPYFAADTLKEYHQLAERLNWAGDIARRHGLRVGYHNHAHEFDSFGGTRPYDLLLRETDPHLVDFELDIYWAIKAGVDPTDLFDRAPGRFPLSHVKGMSADGSFADVGEGVLDYGRIFAEKERAGMQHYFVERDDLPHPKETARDSYRHLRQLTF
ncbi:sugar phosphate isomerase/epimerase [Halopolyspora algeriensis]|uniref:Sugar phosphate isomerase/epimerase n=1 Tax=Halopolyspora algeriensis TaxID=1500506 RepID=A0A368VUM7_9ACTN|nr:sugar phosphate isomerase/epimerase [Halopolyspora algeriensis]RCW45784.1 sugar phosphate isomerase/epimerase [Halopolyspora algeriensis]TQM54168.1 sugar phosphate isomerase/epimerase [Halopolyspora algeriensis]